jgi:membrane-associated phospholipid phosphatase
MLSCYKSLGDYISIAGEEQSRQRQTASDQILFRCIILLAAIFFCFQFIGSAQEPASAAPSAMEASGEVVTAPPAAEAAQSPASQKAEFDTESVDRSVSLSTVIPDILHDQKPIWLFPVHVMEGKHVKPALALTLITAGLIALDPHGEPYFRNKSDFKTYQTGALRGRNTALIFTLIPVATYFGGRLAKDSYATNTAWLAGEAVVETEVLSLAMKGIAGRLRPSEIPPHGDFSHTWFKWGGTLSNPGSFPSGHSSSAFGVAAIFAERYREHRWVPWVAYGLASFVALSRVPGHAHFPSDIFAGAVLGYSTGHFVVLRR